jgi:transcriptional regulator of acetoin/glycerol metabolism
LARSGTMEKAAEILGIDASTLWRKRKKYEG